MTTTLRINADESVKSLYESHSTFHEGDAGLDLFIPNDMTILGGETVFVDLEIRCEMRTIECSSSVNSKKSLCFIEGKVVVDDQDVCTTRYDSYFLYPRSSISKTPLMISNSVGIIDSGYRGNIIVSLRNISTEPCFIKRGDRLVQICARDLSPFKFELVNTLSTSSRGTGCFGSTGK
jgi:dUTP pyrophosphatase